MRRRPVAHPAARPSPRRAARSPAQPAPAAVASDTSAAAWLASLFAVFAAALTALSSYLSTALASLYALADLDPARAAQHLRAAASLVGRRLDDAVLAGLAREMWWSSAEPGEAAAGTGKAMRRRRRAEGEARAAEPEARYFPGMANLSGTLCYMNSVLQAIASVPSFLTHLDSIIALAVEVDIPTPVSDALVDVLNDYARGRAHPADLNTPHARPPRALRPVGLLHALQTLPAVVRLLGTREQQDAHELFVVLAAAVADEALAVAAEAARARGLGDVLALQGYVVRRADAAADGNSPAARRKRARGVAQPWEGLLARRRVCARCGWSESVRVETLGGMELPLPLSGNVSLEACIAAHLAPEQLSDVTCELCSLRQTAAHYAAEAERLGSAPRAPAAPPAPAPGATAFDALRPQADAGGAATASRKKRAQAARKIHARLAAMLESGAVAHFGEPALPPAAPGQGALALKWQTARTASTREARVARPPRVLRLHLVRSEYTAWGQLVKKSARVGCPLVLNLAPFMSRGVWEDGAGASPAPSVRDMLARPEAARQNPAPRALYRLEAAIMHYGYTHSSGHYICVRRKPQPRAAGRAAPAGEQPAEARAAAAAHRPVRGRKSCPDGCVCTACAYHGQVREPATPGRGWLRISDADVAEVGPDELAANAAHVFMLFYERVDEAPERQSGHVAGAARGEGMERAKEVGQAPLPERLEGAEAEPSRDVAEDGLREAAAAAIGGDGVD